MPIATFCPHCAHRYNLDDRLAGKTVRCKACGQGFTVPDIDRSPSGHPIYRHEANVGPPKMATGATPFLEQITAHLEGCIGPAPMVFHEILSPEVHLDLHIVPPQPQIPASEDRPLGGDYYTVFTTGMSSKPMPGPEGAARYAELLIALPSDWPGMSPEGTFDQDAMKEERNWWPFRWIKTLARMPHEYETFLDMGHTIPNGDPAEPFADNTKLCCWMIAPSTLCPVPDLEMDADTSIRFFSCLPLYREEMELKLKKGVEALIDRFEKCDAFISELIEVDRPNTANRKWWKW